MNKAEALKRLDALETEAAALRKIIEAPEPAGGECNCVTCTCDPNMTPAVRFDLSPAQMDGAIRENLIRLGWTPPDEHAQQPAEGEEIMVNTPYDVFTLPLQPSGLSSGPRFVVHVPVTEQPAAPSAPVGVEDIIEAFDEIAGLCRHMRQGGPAPEDLQDLSAALDEAVDIAANMLHALAQQQGGRADG